MAKRAVLAVGASGRFHGIYHAHWEWPRFEVRLPRRRWWPWPRTALCQLVAGDTSVPAAMLAAQESVGRGPGRRLAVTVDADVVAEGHFGHRGTLRWRLRVRRWVAVDPLS